MPDCDHHWVLDSIEEAAGTRGRMVRLHCDKCSEPRSVITAASEDDINAEIAAQ